MKHRNLIIYQFPTLYQILKEIEKDINFNITEAQSQETLKKQISNFNDYIIVTNKKDYGTENSFSLNLIPIKIQKFIEKINVEFMKKHFSTQSRIKINNYILDLNSREIFLKEKKLKLTEKEVNTIIYLSKSKNTVNIGELEKNVWQYQTDMETHTVETHIYRLRKKFLKSFNDESFIISKKNGYQIK